jgi:hypothetical protein
MYDFSFKKDYTKANTIPVPPKEERAACVFAKGVSILNNSVMDPHWFQCGIGSSFFGQCGSGSRDLMTKISNHFTVKHFKKITLYLSLGLHEKTSQATGEAFSPHREHSALQNNIFLNFFFS